MSFIVGVHGIGQQQSGRHQLLATWSQAALDGLERASMPEVNGIKLSWNRHQPEDDFRQRRQPGRLAVLAGLVAASGALGLAFVAASGAARNEMTVVGDLSGQVGGELVKELRGKSIRSR